MTTNTNINTIHFPDESPQAHAIRARLAAGDHAFVHDTGNGYVVADPPMADPATAGAFFQVASPEERSAGVLSSWQVVPYFPAHDTPRPVDVFNRAGVVHAPREVPITGQARKTLVSSAYRGSELGVVQARFSVRIGEGRETGNPLSNWNLCWLQLGETWRGHVLGYLNYYPEKQWLRLTTNYGHAGSSMVHRDARRVVLHPLETYTFFVEYVAGSHVEVKVIPFDRAETIATIRETRMIAPSISVDGDWRLAFGHERDEKDAKLEPGWGYQWLYVQLTAAQAAGAPAAGVPEVRHA